jgi:DNA topoisomerase-2
MPPKVPKSYEKANDRWEFAVALSPDGEFRSVSFVNGIATSKGGKHVDYIINKITKKLTTLISEKKKIDVKPSTIKEQLLLFLRCDIDNPSFDSQTKDFMNTPSSGFGSNCDVSDAFIEKLAKMGVTSMACAMTELKNNKSAKKTDGTKTKSVRGIPKLVDANFAGTTKSNQCCLLLCEGDSAKAGVISGLSRQDRDYFGVYPMKGKIMNVRGETLKRVSDNKEVAEIKKILGLEVGRSYSPADVGTKLRYGKIVFMTDQDLDGSHIKGLGVNLFHCQWPSLASIQGFISFMNTPILKARRSGKEDLVFYNMGEFGQWQQKVGENEANKWNIKYYKGLGTSTSHEFKEYFSHKRFVDFVHNTSSNDTIDLVFNKKRTEDRKTWLSNYERDAFLNTTDQTVTYTDFLNMELKHFSKYDCERSIPNMVDGLKTSQRKIIFAAFKKNLNKELKVAQFSGYVSEVSGYHHGEASLNGAIIGMAQTFVGSNNINLLQPNGQFGTRLQGGHDSASERYIFTQLNPITRAIFMSEDSNVLNYLDDDGLSVEPDHYIPIIPMLLVNGAKGIGTGFSCNFLCYNIEHIIQHVKAMIRGATREERNMMPLEPYYEGFKGTIVPFYKIHKMPIIPSPTSISYLIMGKYTWLDSQRLHITELPIGVWTDDYKETLEELIEKKSLVKEYVDMSTDTSVDLILTMLIDNNDKMCAPTVIIGKAVKESSESDTDTIKVSELEKSLKLYTTMSSSNMHAFDHNEHLRKYSTVHDIIEEHFYIRMQAYLKRRQILLEALKREKIIISNKVKFIMGIINGKLNINYKKYAVVVTLLDEDGFDRVDGEFKYLTQMPMESVTEENVARLKRELDEKTQKYEAMMSKTEHEMWSEDLASLSVLYAEYKRYRMELQNSSVQIELTKAKSKPRAASSKSTRAAKK